LWWGSVVLHGSNKASAGLIARFQTKMWIEGPQSEV